MQITRHGYYTVKGPDGEFLVRPDGRKLRVTSRDECYEWILNDGRAGEFRIECPDRTVRVIGSVADPGQGDTTAPSVPTGVQATAVNKNRVDVSWNASTDDVGVAGYQVFRDGSPLDTVDHPATSYTDNTVLPSTLYSYSIAAYDDAGNTSAQSGAESVTTPANSAPTWDSVPDQDLIVGNSLTLNLGDYADDADTEPLTYTVQSGTLPTGLTLSGSTISGTPTVAGESSAVTVRADDGNDTADTVINFATFDADVTAPPVPSAPTVAGFTANTVTLTLTAVTDAAGSANEYVSGTSQYRIYRDGALVQTQPGLLYLDTGLSAGTSYSYTVAAVDAEGNASAQSAATVQETSASAPWPRGCPLPTDSLPGGYQTSTTQLDIPTPNSVAGYPYDPRTYTPARPANWPSAESVGDYYVDSTHPSATDSGNAYGYPDQPRASFPSNLTLGAGAYVVNGGGSHGNIAEWTWTHNGTASEPTYVVCENGGTFNGDGSGWEQSGTHMIFANCAFLGERPRIFFTGSPYCRFVTLRDSTFTSNGNPAGGRCVGFAGSGPSNRSTHLFIYNCDFQDIGQIPKVSSQDWHAFQPTAWCSHMWMINCTGNRINGDFVQMATSFNSMPNDTPGGYPHYAWIGGCVVSECGEQFIDCKGSYHVTISDNTSYDMDLHGTGANVTNIVFSNNSESNYSGPKWLLFNTVYNNSTGTLVRDSGTCNDEYLYAIGNIVYTGSQGFNIDYGGQNPSGSFDTLTRMRYLYLINNTVVDVNYGFQGTRLGDSGQTHTSVVHGNIFANSATASIWFDAIENAVVTENCYWDSDGPVTIIGNQFQSGYDPADELYDQDPLFTNLAGRDFTLQAGSPCIDACTVHEAYQTYEDWYGMDIRFGHNGVPFPASGPINIGAIQ